MFGSAGLQRLADILGRPLVEGGQATDGQLVPTDDEISRSVQNALESWWLTARGGDDRYQDKIEAVRAHLQAAHAAIDQLLGDVDQKTDLIRHLQVQIADLQVEAESKRHLAGLTSEEVKAITAEIRDSIRAEQAKGRVRKNTLLHATNAWWATFGAVVGAGLSMIVQGGGR